MTIATIAGADQSWAYVHSRLAASKADSEKLVAPEPTTTMSVWIWVAIVGDEEEAKQKQKKR